LGNGSPTTQTQEYLEERVASSETGVDDDLYDEDPRDDDLYDEDPRVVETHSRIGDLTDYLWSIPVEGDNDTEVDVDSVETVPDERIEAWFQDQIEDWLDSASFSVLHSSSRYLRS
jgi:hypothetical protein